MKICSINIGYSDKILNRGPTLAEKVWSFSTHFSPHRYLAGTLPRKCAVYP